MKLFYHFDCLTTAHHNPRLHCILSQHSDPVGQWSYITHIQVHANVPEAQKWDFTVNKEENQQVGERMKNTYAIRLAGYRDFLINRNVGVFKDYVQVVSMFCH